MNLCIKDFLVGGDETMWLPYYSYMVLYFRNMLSPSYHFNAYHLDHLFDTSIEQ